jgi:Chain length determinant protein
MEIIDYLRILRRRRLVLVLVPLLAVSVAVAWALLKPPTYAAAATVNGTALVGTATSQFTGPQGVSQFVSAFDAAATGPYVLNVVSDKTAVPVRDLRDGLVVTQVGDSSSMRVAFQSGKRDTVDPVLSTTVRETLNALFQPRADQAVRDRDAAAQQLEAANAEAEAFAAKQGNADPAATYQALVSQISNLEQQQATLRANGNAVSAAALEAPLKSARAKAATYGPILAEFDTVQAKQRAAGDALASAQEEYRLATGALTATSADRVVFISGVSSAAAANDAWALVLPVLGAGIFAALVLVFALELLARSRAQRRGDDEPPGVQDAEVDGATPDRLAPTDDTAAVAAQGGEPLREMPRSDVEVDTSGDDGAADPFSADHGDAAGDPAEEERAGAGQPVPQGSPSGWALKKAQRGRPQVTREPRRR